MLDPVVLDHPRTRAFSTARKQRRLPSTPSPGLPPPRKRKCVRECVYVSCSARAQDGHFQDTTFSIAFGFTLTSLKDCSYTYHDHDPFTKSRNHLLLCRVFAIRPAKPKRSNSNAGFTASTPHHTKPGPPAAALRFSSTSVSDRIRSIYPSKMMSSRNINNLPAHGAPSRDDFAKLDERQRDQINDVVCCLGTRPFSGTARFSLRCAAARLIPANE